MMVRRVGKHYEYYIQQGKDKINFFVDQETFDDLRIAQALAVQAPQIQAGVRAAIALSIAETDQKKSAV